jgi:hypothetical protein
MSGTGQTDPVQFPPTQNRVTAIPNTRAAHAARPAASPARVAAVAAIVGALGLAAGLGVTALLGRTGPSTSTPTSAQLMTVTPSPFPMTGKELSALGPEGADFGPLADPTRRNACLQGLGYPPPVAVRGARQIDIGGVPAVIMVLPGPGPGDVVALAVRPDCSGTAPRLVADTTVTRP